MPTLELDQLVIAMPFFLPKIVVQVLTIDSARSGILPARPRQARGPSPGFHLGGRNKQVSGVATNTIISQ